MPRQPSSACCALSTSCTIPKTVSPTLSESCTPAEERFNRITRTAQKLFNVPVALVNFFDDKQYQFFKIKDKFDSEKILCNLLFCRNLFLDNTSLIISDAAQDMRFQNNPLVTGAPHIRFYAGMPLQDKNGNLVGALCLIDYKPRDFFESQITALADLAAWVELELDILRVRQAKAVVRENETRLKAVIESAGDAIISIEEDSRVKTFNPAAARIFGYKPENIIGHHIGRLVAKEHRSQIGVYMQELLANSQEPNKELRREVMGQHADGTTFEAEMVVAQIKIKEKREFIAIVRNISESKKIERMKNDFVSTVSHELRTPLTSIRGSLGLLLGNAAGEIPMRARKLLEIANNNCERLIRLINYMLDIQKIESGHMHFNIGIYPLIPLVHQAIDATQSFAMQFQVKFNLQALDSGELVCVSTDPDRLVRVIVNLLSNAAKFSPVGGTVDIKVKQQGTSIRLSVIDQGPGIPDEFRDRIFGKFAQANSSDSHQKTGTGLGLSISKTIVERLGGHVGFNSKLGIGSEFFFDLPVAIPARLITSPAASVLICEVDPDMANLLARMLEKGGFSSDVALTAEQARSMLMAHDYWAMTLNFELPGENGLSLLRWLRSQEKTKSLPVVMVSAQGQHQKDYVDGIDGGIITVIDWMTKPIDEMRLLAAIGSSTRQKEQNGKPCVLYVEDDADLASVINALLEPAWEVTHAINLAAAQKQLEQHKFDVILLDLQFPEGNGSELLCALPALNIATPVIIFSGQEGSQYVSKRVQRVLVKSRTSNEQLLDTLHTFIDRDMAQADQGKIL